MVYNYVDKVMTTKVRILSKLNWKNYLPLKLYKKMIDDFLQKNGKEDEAAEIINWLISDTSKDATDYHKDVILQLFADVNNSRLEYLNPNRILSKIAINFYESKHPGFIDGTLKNIVESIKINIK